MQLSVVILNWNAAEDTIRCVQQFADWQRLQVQIWVVDNASQDDSLHQIRLRCPQVHLIANPQNLGFAGGTNRGLEAALAASSAPILLLNNDTHVEEATLLHLLQTLETNPTYGVIGPLLYQPGASPRLIAAGGRNPVLQIHNLNTQLPATASLFPVDYISGSVALIRAELLRTIGLLDERYFFNTEVADFCRRAQAHGYLTGIDSRVRAYHDLDRSSPLRSTLYTYYLIRNRFLYVRNFYQWTRPLLTAFWALYSWALAAKLTWDGHKASAQAVWLGAWDGLRGRFGGQNARVLAACAKAGNPS